MMVEGASRHDELTIVTLLTPQFHSDYVRFEVSFFLGPVFVG
jgi:hypothetical protein